MKILAFIPIAWSLLMISFIIESNLISSGLQTNYTQDHYINITGRELLEKPEYSPGEYILTGIVLETCEDDHTITLKTLDKNTIRLFVGKTGIVDNIESLWNNGGFKDLKINELVRLKIDLSVSGGSNVSKHRYSHHQDRRFYIQSLVDHQKESDYFAHLNYDRLKFYQDSLERWDREEKWREDDNKNSEKLRSEDSDINERVKSKLNL